VSPKYANVYLYRENRIMGAAVSWDVRVDDREVGSLPTRSFFLTQLPPGEHTVSRADIPRQFIDMQPGKNYFVRIGGGSVERVSPAEGQEGVLKCKRVELRR
jgi:hypothetical protein